MVGFLPEFYLMWLNLSHHRFSCFWLLHFDVTLFHFLPSLHNFSHLKSCYNISLKLFSFFFLFFPPGVSGKFAAKYQKCSNPPVLEPYVCNVRLLHNYGQQQICAILVDITVHHNNLYKLPSSILCATPFPFNKCYTYNETSGVII